MKQYAKKAYGGVGIYIYIHVVLTSALSGDVWSASRPYPGGKPPVFIGEEVRKAHMWGVRKPSGDS
jgi:hypothetical protein